MTTTTQLLSQHFGFRNESKGVTQPLQSALPLISYGNYVSSQAPLKEATLEDVYKIIAYGSDGLDILQMQLREALSLDKKRYDRHKTHLPFFCGSVFTGGIRRSDNFSHSHYMVIDIDDVGDELARVFQSICADSQTILAFVSPSGQGIKVVFRFDKAIHDANLYSVIYKNIVKNFGQKYNLSSKIDFCTHDAARVCFLAHDKDVYFNPNAEVVNTSIYAESDELLFGRDAVGGELAQQDTSISRIPMAHYQSGPDEKQMVAILKKLNPGYQNRAKPDVELIHAMSLLKADVYALFEDFNLQIVEFRPIAYGMTLYITDGQKKAEINLFYSPKKGYSIVKMPKKGCHPDLTEYCAQLLRNLLHGMP